MSFMPNEGPVVNSREALQRLVQGNRRFVRGDARFPTVQKKILSELAREQRPYATILGCSDSRVPPELLFDAGFGELFVIRVAGNTLSADVAGSLQYAGRAPANAAVCRARARRLRRGGARGADALQGERQRRASRRW
jgi:carbonic anhydrase